MMIQQIFSRPRRRLLLSLAAAALSVHPTRPPLTPLRLLPGVAARRSREPLLPVHHRGGGGGEERRTQPPHRAGAAAAESGAGAAEERGRELDVLAPGGCGGGLTAAMTGPAGRRAVEAEAEDLGKAKGDADRRKKEAEIGNEQSQERVYVRVRLPDGLVGR